jgi:peptidoglycan/xylan/chitin deacetylase (PgdA/CDA1 family)
LAALLVVSLGLAVPVAISWARGRKPAPVSNLASRPTTSPVAASTSESVSAPAPSSSTPAPAAADASASVDTSWQDRYRGKIALGFKPEPGYKAVALTFDDGPNYQTAYVLRTLEEHGGKGTFFFSGTLLKRKGATKHAVLVEDAGSEVANHTMNHAINDISAMWRRPYEFDVAQATGPDKLVKPVIGHNTLWLRPMGGNIDANGVKAANDTGHLVINWTVDSNDSHGGPRTPDYIYDICTKNVKSGDVILLHVTKKESMAALPRICAELDRRGFKLVTLSELAQHSTPITTKIPK